MNACLECDAPCCRAPYYVVCTAVEIAIISLLYLAYPSRWHRNGQIQWRDDGRCWWLDDLNRCDIYSVRPSICRRYTCGAEGG